MLETHSTQARPALVRRIQTRRMMQLFWAVEVFLVMATVQRLALGHYANAVVLIMAAAALSLSPWLALRDRTEWAAAWLLYLMTALVFYFLWISDGLRDESLLGYPAILVISSIISNSRVFASLVGVMSLSLLFIGIANSIGWYRQDIAPNNINAAVLIVMILWVTSFSIRLLIDDIRRLVTELSDENRRHLDARARIEKLAGQDALTGLPNRVRIAEDYEALFEQSRDRQLRLALVFIDLDNFKPINDSLGHGVGDDYLRAVARKLSAALEGADSVARFGGDEFVVLMAEVADESDVGDRVQRLLDSLRQPLRVRGHELSTTASVGIAMAPDDGDAFADLLKKADIAMYDSKSAGRNGLRFFNESMNRDAQEDVQMITDLRKALAGEQLSLYFQPKLDLASESLVGCEALIRWHHPTKGLVSPASFIPLAERSGLIIDIGAWVIHEACQAMNRLDAAGFAGLTMSINVSALQFRRGDVQTVVRTALKHSGVSGKRLELEITESLLIDGGDSLARILAELRAMGLQFSIDDFGTGYSNLGYLKELEVSTLKIDRSFVSRLHLDEKDEAIVRAIVQMAASLNLNTVAEGVETRAEAQRLVELGCAQAQGYYWGRPMPEADFMHYLQQASAG